MIAAVDTSVLLDVFLPDDTHGAQSKAWLTTAYDAGAIVVSDIVYAELIPAFRGRKALDNALRTINAMVSHWIQTWRSKRGCAGKVIERPVGRGNASSPIS